MQYTQKLFLKVDTMPDAMTMFRLLFYLFRLL